MWPTAATRVTSFPRTVPVLRVFDTAKAVEFYVDWLGCQIDWEHRFYDDAPLYMQVSSGDLVLHLSEHHGDCCPGAKVFVEVDDIESLHRELIGKKYKYNRPQLETAPWKARTFTVTDPFGNRVQFNEDLD